jgi:hypothetical protein
MKVLYFKKRFTLCPEPCAMRLSYKTLGGATEADDNLIVNQAPSILLDMFP